MTSLEERATGKNNHFNLLRIILSFLVFFCHCYALRFGKKANVMDPISGLIGHWIGDLAVDGFFALSGYLVTGSLFRSNSFTRYLWARVIRIYPGLIVMLILLIVFMSSMSSVSLKAYLTSRETLSLILHNATLIWDIRYTLPGVFSDNLYPRAVNGSLWTLTYEVRFYLLIGALWFTMKPLGAFRKFSFLLLTILTLLSLCFHEHVGLDLEAHYIRFGIIFCVGSLLWQISPFVPTSRAFFVIAALLTAYALRSPQPPISYMLLMPYVAICAAYLKIPLISPYARVGDYSYGLYIYSFPVQQTFSHYYPSMDIGTYIGLTFTVTMVLSYFSWQYVEKPCLALKNRS